MKQNLWKYKDRCVCHYLADIVPIRVFFLITAILVLGEGCAIIRTESVVAMVGSHKITLFDITPHQEDAKNREVDIGRADSVGSNLNYRGERLVEIVLGELYSRYARQMNIEPTSAEINLCLSKMEATDQDEDDKRWARSFVLNEKVSRSLWNKYGGRVVLSSLGFTYPIDAVKEFMKQKESEGAFKILDESLRPVFWKFVLYADMGDAIVPEKEAKEYFEW